MEINKWNILLITTKTCFRVMVLLNGKSFKNTIIKHVDYRNLLKACVPTLTKWTRIL